MIDIAPHPLLELDAFVAELPRPLEDMGTPDAILAMLRADAPAPLARSEDVRQAVRDLLRHGGFKPTGRSKPSSEYLLRAAADGTLGTINVAADAGNAVSLHSGLPISVVDVDRLVPPLAIAVSGPGESYVFNAGGQVIDVAGLIALRDAGGPCANAVKDAQRTKTDAGTRGVLVIVWGTNALAGRAAQAGRWCADLLRTAGATVQPVIG